MGLLDSVDPALIQGLLAGGFGALASRGSRLNAIGQGGLSGLVGYNAAIRTQSDAQEAEEKRKRTALADQLVQMQLARERQQMALEQVVPNILPPTFAPVQGPPTEQGAPPANVAQPIAPGGIDYADLATRYAGMPGGLNRAMQLQAMLQKDTTPITVAKDAVLLDKTTHQPIFSNVQPDKPAELPGAVREYQFAVSQGYRGTFQEWDMERKKAGATSNKVDVHVSNALGGGIAKEVGPMLSASHAAATGAQQGIINSDNLIKAVDSGKVMTGPGATFRLFGAQLGQTIGVGGKDSAEQILNTRAVIQGLAKAAVDARASLKGQGQVSDFEGKLLMKAASGDVDSLTGPEIKLIAQKNKELSSLLVSNHRQFVDRVNSDKDKEISGLGRYFELPTTSASQSSMPTQTEIDAAIARKMRGAK